MFVLDRLYSSHYKAKVRYALTQIRQLLLYMLHML